MTAEDERARPRMSAGQVFFASLALMFLSSISYRLGKIESAIRADTSLNLCLKLAELGGEHPACDRLRGDHITPGGE